MMVNLARGITTLGNPVDLVVRNAENSYLIDLPPSLKLVELDTIHPDVITAAPIYLKDARPRAILASKEENSSIAIKARERSRIESRIVIRVPVHLTGRLRQQKNGPLKTWKKWRKSRNILKQADSLIAVSSGVASDISEITGIPLEKIHTIPNPVVTPDMKTLAGKSIEHDWFTPKDKPV
ncbi:glycosyltransferase, partial [bacterium]|nr:glycosyltransferase [bacterium]